MIPKNYSVRPMSRYEINLAVDWAAAEGWNPGLHDADSFYSADPGGFLAGVLDDAPVASVSVVKYGSTFGFLGFYIVLPDFRGKGLGLALWQAGLLRLAGRNIGLDGVVAQQENYRKSGFRLAYRNTRYEGMGGGVRPDHPAMVDLRQLPFEDVLRYDRPFFPDDRSGFLRAWIHQPESRALGVLRGSRLIGCGMIRPCRAGYKIGPLFADSPDLAESLVLALSAEARPGAPVYLDVPETNPAAVALAERHGMKTVFETARMYTGAFPDLPFARLFGVTSFELG